MAAKPLKLLLAEKGQTPPDLAAAAGLDERVVLAIVEGRYTTSPKHRERIAAALGLASEEINWGQAVSVDHMYGHGPQFGRSP
jgi:cyanate lyase